MDRSFEKRLRKLEDKTGKGYEVPVHVRVHLKEVARLEGRWEPFDEEELQHLLHEDQLAAAGKGLYEGFRTARGWESAEAQEALDVWEESVRSRLERVEEAGEDWRSVYQLEYPEHADLDDREILADDRL